MKDFLWQGYTWNCCMEGGRIMHPSCPYYWYSEDCVTINENDELILTMRKEPRVIKYWDGKYYYPDYACGLLKSKDGFTYGTFKSTLMAPKGKNLSPSFWLSTSNFRWPDGGEIDVMEAWTDNNCYFSPIIQLFPYLVPSWKTTTNIHYAENGEHKHIKSLNVPLCKQIKNPSKNFIEYETIWEPDLITLKVNGKVVRKNSEAAKIITQNWEKEGRQPAMNVIFNLLVEDPTNKEIALYSDMIIKNFEYTPLNQKL